MLLYYYYYIIFNIIRIKIFEVNSRKHRRSPPIYRRVLCGSSPVPLSLSLSPVLGHFSLYLSHSLSLHSPVLRSLLLPLPPHCDYRAMSGERGGGEEEIGEGSADPGLGRRRRRRRRRGAEAGEPSSSSAPGSSAAAMWPEHIVEAIAVEVAAAAARSGGRLAAAPAVASFFQVRTLNPSRCSISFLLAPN